jgi:hypothetical protein
VRQKVAVVGDAGLARRLGEQDYADVVHAGAGEDLAGSDVVVLAAPGNELFDDIRDRAPNAVVLTVGHSPQAVCEAVLFPRARLVGIDGDEPAVVDVVDAILLDRRQVFTCTVRCEGERGIKSEFAAVPVRLGAGGVQEIIEDQA